MPDPVYHALFVAYGGGHVAMVLPVYRELLKTQGWTATMLGLTTAAPYLERQGVPFVGYRHFVGPDDGEAREHGRRLAATMHTPDAGILLEESVAYLGLSYHDLVQRVGEQEADALFSRLGRHAFLPLGVMRRIFAATCPDVVVATNSPKSEKASLMVAREAGIPCVALVDLFGRGEPYPVVANRICVLSEMTRENLVQTGVEDSAVRVTGNPAFDDMHTHLKGQGATWRRTVLGLGEGERGVVWADQAAVSFGSGNLAHLRSAEEVERDLDVMADACSRLGVKMLVRPHPSQSRDFFRAWMARRTAPTLHLVDDAPLYPLLSEADAVVTFTSTVGLQAALLGRPVLTLDYESRPSDLPLGEYGLGLTATSRDEVAPLLRRLLEDQDTRHAIQTAQRRLRPDGHAARRVVAQIEELVGRSPALPPPGEAVSRVAS